MASRPWGVDWWQGLVPLVLPSQGRGAGAIQRAKMVDVGGVSSGPEAARGGYIFEICSMAPRARPIPSLGREVARELCLRTAVA